MAFGSLRLRVGELTKDLDPEQDMPTVAVFSREFEQFRASSIQNVVATFWPRVDGHCRGKRGDLGQECAVSACNIKPDSFDGVGCVVIARIACGLCLWYSNTHYADSSTSDAASSRQCRERQTSPVPNLGTGLTPSPLSGDAPGLHRKLSLTSAFPDE